MDNIAELLPLELARIESRTETPAPEPELSFSARIDLNGVNKVRVGARGWLAIVAVMVLFLIAGAVLIQRGDGASREAPRREDLRRCCECIHRTEVIERTCALDGS